MLRRAVHALLLLRQPLLIRASVTNSTLIAAAGMATSASAAAAATTPAADKIPVDDSQWKKVLSREQFHVLREKGTERAYSSPLDKTFDEGEYMCAGCSTALFTSGDKFNSGCGWPAFDQPAASEAVVEHRDLSLGMLRTEVTCRKCGGHLGHVFAGEGNSQSKTGLRYCINGVSLKFQKKK